MLAYYWSQFNIPIEDLEIVPEFSEERVLEALENGIKDLRRTASRKDIRISEITASSKSPVVESVGHKKDRYKQLNISWHQIT